MRKNPGRRRNTGKAHPAAHLNTLAASRRVKKWIVRTRYQIGLQTWCIHILKIGIFLLIISTAARGNVLPVMSQKYWCSLRLILISIYLDKYDLRHAMCCSIKHLSNVRFRRSLGYLVLICSLNQSLGWYTARNIEKSDSDYVWKYDN